jgi:hypothetical protein
MRASVPFETILRSTPGSEVALANVRTPQSRRNVDSASLYKDVGRITTGRFHVPLACSLLEVVKNMPMKALPQTPRNAKIAFQETVNVARRRQGGNTNGRP